jgi:hypothetical protein
LNRSMEHALIILQSEIEEMQGQSSAASTYDTGSSVQG